MREPFDEHCGSCWGMLLIDARNAFNSLNQDAALWNAQVVYMTQVFEISIQHAHIIRSCCLNHSRS